MISSLLLFATFVILAIPTAIIFIPWSIITGDVLPLYNATQMIVRTGYFLARIRVEVKGRELLPKNTACIFMANHVSNLDPPALIPQYPRPDISISKTVANAHSRPRLGIQAGRIHPG